MKKDLINELFVKFEQACYLVDGIECRSASERQEILGYLKWDDFNKNVFLPSRINP